jgi:type IV secretory pathway TrbD component
MRGTPSLFYQSLNRHFHVLGVERSLFYLFVGICLPIAVAGRLALIPDLISISLFTLLHASGVLITRIDNQILEIYRRHINYQKYYAPQPGIHAQIKNSKPSVPFYIGKRGLV